MKITHIKLEPKNKQRDLQRGNSLGKKAGKGTEWCFLVGRGRAGKEKKGGRKQGSAKTFQDATPNNILPLAKSHLLEVPEDLKWDINL